MDKMMQFTHMHSSLIMREYKASELSISCCTIRKHSDQLRIFMGWCRWWKEHPNHRWWLSTMPSWLKYIGCQIASSIMHMPGTSSTICRRVTTRILLLKTCNSWRLLCCWLLLLSHLMIASMVLTISSWRWRKIGMLGWPTSWDSLLMQREILEKWWVFHMILHSIEFSFCLCAPDSYLLSAASTYALSCYLSQWQYTAFVQLGLIYLLDLRLSSYWDAPYLSGEGAVLVESNVKVTHILLFDVTAAVKVSTAGRACKFFQPVIVDSQFTSQSHESVSWPLRYFFCVIVFWNQMWHWWRTFLMCLYYFCYPSCEQLSFWVNSHCETFIISAIHVILQARSWCRLWEYQVCISTLFCASASFSFNLWIWFYDLPFLLLWVMTSSGLMPYLLQIRFQRV